MKTTTHGMTYTIIDHLNTIGAGLPSAGEYHRVSRLCMAVICRHYGIAEYMIYKRTRIRPIPEVRHMYFFCMAEILNERDHRQYKYTLREIGDVFGFDHATVLHGLKMIEGNILVNRSLRANYAMLFNELHAAGYSYPLNRMHAILDAVNVPEKFV